MSKRTSRSFGFGLLLAIVGMTAGSAQILPVTELEDAVREWLLLRQELVRTQARWQEQQTMLQEERRLLLAEKNRLAGLVAADRDALQGLDRETQRIRARRDEMSQALAALNAPLQRAQADLAAHQSRLPPMLAATLTQEFRQLGQLTSLPDGTDAAKRLQVVLGLYTELEKLSAAVHEGKMIVRGPDTKDREMDVLFVGMAIGYALSPNRALAGVAHPQAGSWTWTWRPDLAKDVQRAIACFRRETPAQFVPLPLRVNRE